MKEHVSYSEVKQWKECSWRHKLLYIDKLTTFEESPHLHYGTIIHDACEHYLKTKELKIEEAQKK
ncbi:PD-(D/E)XK nuclease family protein, partial [Winogradskyella sp.]|uniref:PD-(D/E)XK nuclease family protein n=1 Tax=Winogradskyella sp. TaxID=1883156 RepID=UPI003F6967F5